MFQRKSPVLCASLTLLSLVAVCGRPVRAADDAWQKPLTKADGAIVLQVATAQGEDPRKAGQAAAEALQKLVGSTPLKAVLVSECFEDRENKQKVIDGVAAVLPKQLIVGGATYGSFTQAGWTDADSVCLLGVAGDGIGVSAALVTQMGASKLQFDAEREQVEKLLRDAGEKLARKLVRTPQDRLLILVPDAHSPKNQPLVEGVQQVLGKQFPITGGCANKNAGQTFIYFSGAMYEDAGVALLLSGAFEVALSGRQAKDNEAVIRTAGEGAAAALAKTTKKPIAALAFNCAGRRSKLKNIGEELAAIQKATGKQLPLFGCYCAGEIGPVDMAERPLDALSGGAGWHVMFTVLSQ